MNKVSPIILDILNKRGIIQEDLVTEFLSDKPRETYDPFLLLNLEAGVDLILSTIAENKKICIYGDYDADGITSICILMELLGNLTENLTFYIPSRFDEGYGLNIDAIQKIKDDGADLLVTVDCGSVSYEEVEFAKGISLDVIVTDHHRITDVQADCLLINPKQPGCAYPFKDLAGCGVAFKLAQGLRQKTGLPKPLLNRTLDLVAVGTIGDIVPLLGENRSLVKYGMNVVNAGIRPGLLNLIEGISLKKGSIRSDHVAFGIVPHLNAAGRMEDAKVGVELLLSTKEQEIKEYVETLKRHNQNRKHIQNLSVEACTEIIETKHKNQHCFVVYTGETHEGIAGIVAGKLKDKYQRPVILVTPAEEGLLKGTGRSVPTIDLYKMLKNHDHLFRRFGGHEGACGFLMEQSNLNKLSDGLMVDVEQMLEDNDQLFHFQPEVDLTLQGHAVCLNLAEELELLAPFGSKNPKPLFLLEKVELTRQLPMGEEGLHIRFNAVCDDGFEVQCVLFQTAKDYQELIYGGKPVDLIGSIDVQEWRGNKKVQFIIDTMI